MCLLVCLRSCTCGCVGRACVFIYFIFARGLVCTLGRYCVCAWDCICVPVSMILFIFHISAREGKLQRLKQPRVAAVLSLPISPCRLLSGTARRTGLASRNCFLNIPRFHPTNANIRHRDFLHGVSGSLKDFRCVVTRRFRSDVSSQDASGIFFSYSFWFFNVFTATFLPSFFFSNFPSPYSYLLIASFLPPRFSSIFPVLIPSFLLSLLITQYPPSHLSVPPLTLSPLPPFSSLPSFFLLFNLRDAVPAAYSITRLLSVPMATAASLLPPLFLILPSLPTPYRLLVSSWPFLLFNILLHILYLPLHLPSFSLLHPPHFFIYPPATFVISCMSSLL